MLQTTCLVLLSDTITKIKRRSQKMTEKENTDLKLRTRLSYELAQYITTKIGC